MKKEPIKHVPVSPKDSVGQDLYRYAAAWRTLIIFSFTLAGIIIGLFVGKDGWRLGAAAATFFGFLGWALGTLCADYITIFIEAKAELLINTAKIQEDLDFLCKIKEDELDAKTKLDARQ